MADRIYRPGYVMLDKNSKTGPVEEPPKVLNLSFQVDF